MYGSFIESEGKKWIRDSMTAFMLIYPLLFGVIGRWFVPWIADTSGYPLESFAYLVLVALTLMGPNVYGALIGFSILDDRDDNIFTSIRVSPLSLQEFLSFRFGIALVLAFVTSLYIIWFSNLVSFTFIEVIGISAVASLSAPMVGLMINSLASNKIEGFAVMKGVVAILIIFPIASLFFVGAKEWFFAMIPGFWPAKAMSSVALGDAVNLSLGFWAYLLIGMVYILLLNVIVYKWFRKKALND